MRVKKSLNALHACGSRRDEAQFRNVVEIASVACHLEERVETCTFARAEAVAQLLEVTREESGWVAVALRRFVRELLGLRARSAQRLDERILELRQVGMRRLRRGPHGEHHRESGALEPQPSEVVMRRRVLEGGLQGCVADQ